MTYMAGSLMSRLLGILGLVPSLWIIAMYIGKTLGLRQGGRISGEDALAFFGLALLSILFLVPILERPLLRRSQSRMISLFKMAVVIPASGLLVLAGGAGLMIIDAVADNWRNVSIGAMALLWLAYLYLAVFPGAYAHELDRRAGTQQRGLTRTAGHIKARLSFDTPTHGPSFRPEDVPRKDYARPLLILLLAVFVVAAALAFYGARLAFFVPDYGVVELLERKALMSAAIVAQLTVVLVLLTRRLPGRVILQSRPTEAIVLALVLGSFTYFASGKPLGTGLTAFHSLIFQGTPARLVVEVVAKGRETVSMGCGHIALVRGPDWPEGQHMRVCEVPVEIWDALEPGQRLMLRGNRTGFGLRYDAITRIP